MSDDTVFLPPESEETAEPSDARLISATREGDNTAYEKLYARHRGAAVRCAQQFASREADVDDLVAEAFANVLSAIRKGSGPTEFFRGYLVRTVRHCAFRVTRQQRRTTLTDTWDGHDSAEPARDPAVEAFDNQAVGNAFRSLPERWQAVLWHTEVEGEAPASIAPLLGLRPNSVSALAYRAREGLRTAYIQAHITTADRPCREYAAKLGAYARGKLGRTQSTQVGEHLDTCADCGGLYLELADLSSTLPAAVAPFFLGSAASAYLLNTVGSTAVQQGAAQAGQVVPTPKSAWKSGKALAAAGVTAAVVAAGSLALALTAGHGGSDRAAPAGQIPSPASAGELPPPDPAPSFTAARPAPSGVPGTGLGIVDEGPVPHVTEGGGPLSDPQRSPEAPGASTGAALPQPPAGEPSAVGPPTVPEPPEPSPAPSWPDDGYGGESTPEPTPTPTRTPSPSPSPSSEPTPGPTPTPTPELTPEPTPRPTFSPSPEPSPTPTPSPSPEPTPTPTPTPSPELTPEPTPTPELTPEPTPTPTPTSTAPPGPTPTPTPSPTGGECGPPGHGHGHGRPCRPCHWPGHLGWCPPGHAKGQGGGQPAYTAVLSSAFGVLVWFKNR
ncbi:sigma-70 family RNA polymerase sigma factor [Streptomyces sp. PpalLS-921]|uniref:sigma-70 family RNA polymerase sigma factor n=1 Tax=Streptomyces sp. PpalLS-921 TaxID=1839772 RepID=UPI00081E7B2F|nr:sigma-70 family RNA polymerase sigma factor [Streptomyces sp. PpalLS-921]SCD30857.1 RNA polymerase sigma factor, sigma-70 family [Streptomyces sp. PpalLS-921]